MIRVIYRWRVKPGKEESFRQAWERGTAAIIRTFKASHGSLLLQRKEIPSEFAGIARWDSVEEWEAAHKGSHWPPDREAARNAHAAAGKTISTEVFEELSEIRH